MVGPLGAGFLWPAGGPEVARCSLVPAPAPEGRAAADDSSDDDAGSAAGEVGPGEAEGGAPGAGSGGNHFKREVGETFLRCVKEHISHENIVIELNGLKIAEDKTFADCARYMLTTMLGLCLPAPPATRSEYRELYTAAAPEPGNRAYLLDLLKRSGLQLRRWKDLLHKFLRNEDDQACALRGREGRMNGGVLGVAGDPREVAEPGALLLAARPTQIRLVPFTSHPLARWSCC